MKIILIGKGGSGKDYLKLKLIEKGFNKSISHTTRPIRDGESEGVDYFYIQESEFLQMIENKEFREYNCFGNNKWYYGTSNQKFNEANLFIMTPSGVAELSKEERSNAFVVYLDISEEVRSERLHKRTDIDDPKRRLHTDSVDFENFSDFDYIITEHLFDDDFINDELLNNFIGYSNINTENVR